MVLICTRATWINIQFALCYRSSKLPALVRRLNYRNIELYRDTRGETIGVYLKNGDVQYVRWLGFISVDEAKALDGARPVKLEVSRYTDEPGIGVNWIDVPSDRFVQGCLIESGAFAVTSESVRLLLS